MELGYGGKAQIEKTPLVEHKPLFDSAYFTLVQSDTYCPSTFVLLSGIYL